MPCRAPIALATSEAIVSLSRVGLREIVMILELKRQGLGVSAIARQTGLDRSTVPVACCQFRGQQVKIA